MAEQSTDSDAYDSAKEKTTDAVDEVGDTWPNGSLFGRFYYVTSSAQFHEMDWPIFKSCCGLRETLAACMTV